MDPGDFAAESLAELDRAWIQCPSRGGGPQRELIAVAPALVAVVAVQGDVDRELASPTPRRGFVNGAVPVPLVSSAMQALEAQQVEDLFHAGLAAKPAEVDARNDGLSRDEVVWGRWTARDKPDRSVPLLSMGNGNGLSRMVSRNQSARCQPVGVRRIRPACCRDSKASPSRSFLTDIPASSCQ